MTLLSYVMETIPAARSSAQKRSLNPQPQSDSQSDTSTRSPNPQPQSDSQSDSPKRKPKRHLNLHPKAQAKATASSRRPQAAAH